MKLFGDIYRGRWVLLNGHTEFKGRCLVLWLSESGAKVTGIALPPGTEPNHWDLLRLSIDDRRLEIREFDALMVIVKGVEPDIVFHLADQPLV